jgi:hypothetical protein
VDSTNEEARRLGFSREKEKARGDVRSWSVLFISSVLALAARISSHWVLMTKESAKRPACS